MIGEFAGGEAGAKHGRGSRVVGGRRTGGIVDLLDWCGGFFCGILGFALSSRVGFFVAFV